MEPQALPKGVNPDSVVLVDGVYYEVCVGAGCKKNTKVRFDCPVGERRFRSTLRRLLSQNLPQSIRACRPLGGFFIYQKNRFKRFFEGGGWCWI